MTAIVPGKGEIVLNAVAQLRPLEEFVRDPVLTVACVFLIVVSVAWVVVSRMIYANLKRAASRAERMADEAAAREAWGDRLGRRPSARSRAAGGVDRHD